VHLKVHKALRFLLAQHPHATSIPLKPDNGFEDMAKWDWSKVRVRLVMSVPGSYTGFDGIVEYGSGRLGNVLHESGWRPKADEVVKAEYQVSLRYMFSHSRSDGQGSSLGSYTIDWYDTFYQFCCGKRPRDLLGKAKPAHFAPIKVVFPSLATVDSSEAKRAVSNLTPHIVHCD
jgi:tyrosyl-DNA phosphodiesterase-1